MLAKSLTRSSKLGMSRQCRLSVTDSALLDGQLDEAVVNMPSLSVQEQRDAQLADPAIARLRTLLDDPPMSLRDLRGEPREVLTMMHDASKFHFQRRCVV